MDKKSAVFIGLVFAGRLFSQTGFERALLAFLPSVWLLAVFICLTTCLIYKMTASILSSAIVPSHPAGSHKLGQSGDRGAAPGLHTPHLADFQLPISGTSDIYAEVGGSNLLFALTVAGYLLMMVLYGIHLNISSYRRFYYSKWICVAYPGRSDCGSSVHFTMAIYRTSQLSLFLALCKRRNELILPKARQVIIDKS